MANEDGTNILLYIAGNAVVGSVSQSMETVIDLIDITTKDSSGHKEFLAGEDTTTLSVEGKLDESDAYTYEDLRLAAVTKAAVAFNFGGTTAGDETYSGSCFITNVSQSAPKNAERTWSASMTVTGAVTKGSAS